MKKWWPWVVIGAYALVATWAVWNHSPTCQSFQQYAGEALAERDQIRAKFGPELPAMIEKAKQIRERDEKEGFTSYEQFIEDRAFLISVSEISGLFFEHHPEHGQATHLRAIAQQIIKSVAEHYHQAHFAAQVLEREAMVLHDPAALARWKSEQSRWVYKGDPILWSSVCMPDVPRPFHTTTSYPLGLLGIWLLQLYCSLMPIGLGVVLVRMALGGHKVSELCAGDPWTVIVYTVFWPFCQSFDPAHSADRLARAWLKQVGGALSGTTSERVKNLLYNRWNRLDLGEVCAEMPIVGELVARYRLSRMRRIMVAASVLFILLKPSGSAMAQVAPPVVTSTAEGGNKPEAPAAQTVSAAPVPVMYLPGEAAFEAGPFGEAGDKIRLGLGGSFARFTARQVSSSGEEDPDGTMGMDFLWLNGKLKAGEHWTGRVQVALNENPFGMKQAYAEYTATVCEGTGSLRVGRFFLPEAVTSLPPPWKGMADGRLTDDAFTFFGEGINAAWRNSSGGIGLTCARPTAEPGLPATVILNLDYSFTTSFTVAGVFQADFRHPDEDWLASGEVSGKLGEQWSYEILGVYRERPESIQFGGHSLIEFQPLPAWGIDVQADALRTEKERESVEQYRLTGAVWHDLWLLRLQADVYGDRTDGIESLGAAASVAVHF